MIAEDPCVLDILYVRVTKDPEIKNNNNWRNIYAFKRSNAVKIAY